MKKDLRKPVYWQDFEDLCKVLWGELFNCSDTIKKNGRAGQPQCGVDVYGEINSNGDSFGIQCKGKDGYTHAKLSNLEINSELEKAKNFKPALDRYIIATTANKDANIEEYIRLKNLESKSKGTFSIELYCWEDIADAIEQNVTVLNWYNGVLSDTLDKNKVHKMSDYCSNMQIYMEQFIRTNQAGNKEDSLKFLRQFEKEAFEFSDYASTYLDTYLNEFKSDIIQFGDAFNALKVALSNPDYSNEEKTPYLIKLREQLLGLNNKVKRSVLTLSSRLDFYKKIEDEFSSIKIILRELIRASENKDRELFDLKLNSYNEKANEISLYINPYLPTFLNHLKEEIQELEFASQEFALMMQTEVEDTPENIRMQSRVFDRLFSAIDSLNQKIYEETKSK